MELGIAGFSFEDLYRPAGCGRLAERFDEPLARRPGAVPGLRRLPRLGRHQRKGPAESELLIRVARHVSRFLARLFNIEAELAELSGASPASCRCSSSSASSSPAASSRRARRTGPPLAEFPSLDARMRLLLAAGLPGGLARRTPSARSPSPCSP